MNIMGKEFREQSIEWVALAKKAYKIQNKRKEIEVQELELKNELKKISDYQNACGDQFAFEKIIRKGSIQYSSIPFLQLMDLEQFRGPSNDSWKLYKI